MFRDPLIQMFSGVFLATGAALATAIALGRARRIRGHIAAVVTFLLLFLVTVGFAEAVGRHYHFDRTTESVHLPMAIAGALSALGPVVTGFRRWRGSGSLRAHRIAIVVFLALFVGATTTGVIMLSTGEPR
jgi:hypothetical protein